jgi:tetratricopeptide (TPR) repeat protein
VRNAKQSIITQMTLGTILAAALLSGCASMRNFFAVSNPDQPSGPIHNPFGDFYAGKNDPSQNVVLRTKKGDRSVEVELPAGTAQMTDLTIPVSPAFRDGARGPASGSGTAGGYDDAPYTPKTPTIADREITRAFPQASNENEATRREVEQGLGLMPSEDSTPEATESYLGALDHVKGMYKQGRYEAALVEMDALIRQYPTAPKLHQMRGTLLDRVGQPALALKSWKQALQFEPNNEALKRFVERREQKRSLASP